MSHYSGKSKVAWILAQFYFHLWQKQWIHRSFKFWPWEAPVSSWEVECLFCSRRREEPNLMSQLDYSQDPFRSTASNQWSVQGSKFSCFWQSDVSSEWQTRDPPSSLLRYLKSPASSNSTVSASHWRLASLGNYSLYSKFQASSAGSTSR